MQQTGQSITKPRNPKTQAAHNREVLWQIIVPLLIGAVVIIAVAVFASLGTTIQVSQRADVALIWLILPAIVFTLIFLVINAAIVYLFIRLIGVLPGYMYQVQIFFDKVAFYTHKASDTISSPFIRINGFSALVRRVFRRQPKRV
jgi:hypothetical protein